MGAPLSPARAARAALLISHATWAHDRARRPRPGSLLTPAELRIVEASCRQRAAAIEAGAPFTIDREVA